MRVRFLSKKKRTTDGRSTFDDLKALTKKVNNFDTAAPKQTASYDINFSPPAPVHFPLVYESIFRL